MPRRLSFVTVLWLLILAFRAVSIRRTAGVANNAMSLLDLDNMED
jgi:hypothetical protein